MTVTPGFTADEIARFVRAYLELPYGTKTAWLKEQPFSKSQFWRWRDAYLSGDLERGLVPRSRSSQNAGLAKAKAAEEELVRVQQAAREQIDALVRAHELELVERDAQIKMLKAGNVALGKAIGLLQNLSLQEPENAGTNPDRGGSNS